ncbi:PepSY domain-containing protein [Phenylobacterium sp.]|uniref:PepSY domain-containing protein n=1 Tax=Phenylobacterium sp. TaxID=1871053 RepID=UPI002C9CB1BB|nr:PepSY domain-containing protein [Phenylobacterium sp.]HVI32025.1 PepSY domain-containing protein [Phenylobacterium sp.]
MRWPALARKTHKWLALVVAIQAVFWTLSGVYMTAVHIDIIHGDRLVKAQAAQPIALAGLVEPAHLAHLAPGMKSARLETQLGQPVYVVQAEGGPALFDARTGQKLSPLNADQAKARAQALFAEDGRVVSVEYLTKAPLEIQTRPVPVWRVEFEGAWRPTFYISPVTGELVSRRHDLWRTFDFVWMFHIMDYDDRQDVNNVLIRVFTWLAVATAASGAWLLLYSFRRKRRVRKAAA